LYKIYIDNLRLRAKTIFKSVLDSFDRKIIVLFSKSGFTASLYYAIFNRSFYREHQAVISGRIAYQKSLKKINVSCVLLRRNTHRLEKGLTMRPRRSVFAEGYIKETVDYYCEAVKSLTYDRVELKWVEDVLFAYFDAVSETDTIREAKSKFLEFKPDKKNEELFMPYTYSELGKVVVSFEQLLQLVQHRRSVRWFQDKEVPVHLIKKAVSIATYAPSACNRQPFKFYVMNTRKKAVAAAKLAGGTIGYADNIRCLIAVVGELDAYPYERDRHLIYIDGSLASMQLMLAFETLGLSSCAINWPSVEEKERKMELFLRLPVNRRLIMLLAVGYATDEGGIPYSQKKSSEILIREVF
jgi:nitroreductase